VSAHFPRGASGLAALLLLALAVPLPAAAQPQVATPVWRTYLGGGGVDRIIGVAHAANGDVVVVGSTTSQDLSPSAATTELGASNAFMARFTAEGVRRHIVVFGGSGRDEAIAVALSPSGDVYIVGRTASATVTGAGGVHRGFLSADDAFLSKVKADGTPEWFMYLAGHTGTEMATGVAVSATGEHVFVTGWSTSANLAGNQGAIFGNEDGFVMKVGVASASSSVAPTIDAQRVVGGDQLDQFFDIKPGPGNTVLVVGTTGSSSFTSDTQPIGTKKAGTDMLVARLDLSVPAQDDWLNFVGSSGNDEGTALQLAMNGQIVVAGTTSSDTFDDPQAPTLPNKNSFVAWLASDGTVNRTQLLGGGGTDETLGLALDSSSNLYIAGRTTSGDLARTHPFDGTIESGSQAQEGFVTMHPAQLGRGWSSYVGGDSRDEVGDISLFYTGTKYQLIVAGQTFSSNGFFPTTTAPYDSSLSLKGDGYIVALELTDTTPPIAGTVVSSATQADTFTTLSANWSAFSDPQGSIQDYEWALWRPGETTPLKPYEVVMDLQGTVMIIPRLEAGTTYYVTVRGNSSVGLASEARSLDVVVTDPPDGTDGGTGGPDGGTGTPDGGTGTPDGGTGTPDGGTGTTDGGTDGGMDAGTGGGADDETQAPLGWGCASAGGAGLPLLLGLIAFMLLARRLGQPSR
jgi:hypothetical protein